MFDAALVHWLRSCAPLKALVDDRVFPLNVPQGEKRPCLVWQLIVAERVRTANGPEGTGEPHYQLKAWAETVDEADEIADAVVGTLAAPGLDGYTGYMGPTGSRLWVQNAEVHGVQHLYEKPVGGEASGAYCVMFEVHIWYNEV